MFGPTHLLHGRMICENIADHDLSIGYVAHITELDRAVLSLLKGDDFEFSFEPTEADRLYLAKRLKDILGPDFLLDFH